MLYCQAGQPESHTCRICQRAKVDAAFRAIVEKVPPPRKAVKGAPLCSKLGGFAGITRPCQGCGGKVQQVPLRVCGEFGVCAVGKSVKLEDGTPVRPCNTLCPAYEAGDCGIGDANRLW